MCWFSLVEMVKEGKDRRVNWRIYISLVCIEFIFRILIFFFSIDKAKEVRQVVDKEEESDSEGKLNYLF